MATKKKRKSNKEQVINKDSNITSKKVIVSKDTNNVASVDKTKIEIKKENGVLNDKIRNDFNTVNIINMDNSNKKSREEELVFKDSKKVLNNTNIKKTQYKEKNEKDKSSDFVKKDEIKKEVKFDKNKEKDLNKLDEKDVFEEKKNKKRKIMIVMIILLISLFLILCFSTIFAILGSFTNTIARGVSIAGVDLSNLTYNEAKQKMMEMIDVELTPDIELIYNNYKYTIKTSDIKFEYKLTEALEKAYNVGRTGNIVENNYSLIKTAIFGEEIMMESKYDMDALNAIIDIIDTNIPGRVKQYSYYIDGVNLIVNPGEDGVQVKSQMLKKDIVTSLQARDYNNILENYDSIKINIPYKQIRADKIDMAKIAAEIYSEPQNAYYVEATETTDFEIYPAKAGISLAISTEEAQMQIDSERKDEYVVPLIITEADIQLNDIGIEAFPYKINTFSTRYDASNYGRSENLKIAANKINGTVLMPGEIFSFNNVVGERTVAGGYKNAKIYSNGQVVDGLAGGICQISSTLYNVVLLSNLEIVERYNHSFTTSYVAPGRDATVVYGIKDFKFKNTRNYPIKIEANVSAGVATFSIYGIKEENEYTIKIIPKTTQTTPYTTKTITDNTLEPGMTRVTQAGASGCKVTTYKESYLNGTLISNEILSNDVYQVMTRIVRVGPTIESVSAQEINNMVQ